MAESPNQSCSLAAVGGLNVADSLEEGQGRPKSEEMRADSGASQAEVAVDNGASLPPSDEAEPEIEEKGEEQEARHLLNIFPTEVWLLILENVEESEAADFQRISNASSYFGTLLQPRALEMLFPSVIKILIEHQPQLLSTRDVLSLREVCVAWKDGLDEALQDQEFFYLLEKDQLEIINSGNDPRDSFEKFLVPQDFLVFKEHFDRTHLRPRRSPLLLRGITLEIPEEEQDFRVYYRRCLRFLVKYGTHVWHCQISLAFTDKMQQLKFYKSELKFLLKFMRHLKTLKFVDLESHDFQGRYLQKLAGSLSVATLPFLPQLRKIDVSGMPASFLRAMVTRNPDIQVVDGSGIGASAEHVKVYLEQMANLTRLSVVLSTGAELEAFSTAQATCPLEVLHLEVELMDQKMLCRAIETLFSNTLKELYVELPRSSGNQIEIGDWNLPNLKQLTVKLSDPMTRH